MIRACAAALAALALTGSAAAAGTGPQPPLPPQVRGDPPAGAPPGPAAGLRSPQRCTPPPADDDTSSGGSGGSGTGAARLQLTEVHRLATGRGQLIAVIDTGVYPHRSLGDRLRGGGDYLTGADGREDCDGHGTAVAGLLAAAAEPGPDGRVDPPISIAPGAQLLAIRQSSPSFTVPGPDGDRPAGDTDTLAEAIVLAVREGAGIVNISEAVCLAPDRAAVAGASLHAALRYAAEARVVVVAAAGNVGTGSCGKPGSHQVSLPGWYDDELITVGAVGPDDTPAPFTVPGPWVDVAAPGTGLRSLAVGGGTTTTGVEGTSFAVPWVAGLAALVRERFPELTAQQVTDRILATARRPAGGQDDALGYGVIDPIAALTAVPAVLVPRPEVETRIADLPGIVRPPAASDPIWPGDLAVAGTLLAASVAAAVLLRRGPRRVRRSRVR